MLQGDPGLAIGVDWLGLDVAKRNLVVNPLQGGTTTTRKLNAYTKEID